MKLPSIFEIEKLDSLNIRSVNGLQIGDRWQSYLLLQHKQHRICISPIVFHLHTVTNPMKIKGNYKNNGFHGKFSPSVRFGDFY